MSGAASLSTGFSRVFKELKELHNNLVHDCPPLCAVPFEDTTDVLALIVGPPNTPYAFGFFFFLMKFNHYPSDPPQVQILTTNGGQTRFNPNLYADGKVCLSILGTWEGDEGEMWRPSYTISHVLMAIQSLVMTEEPFRNEPGFETYNVRDKMRAYNAKVTHETLRLAVCDTMEAILDNKLKHGSEFSGLIKSQFLMYYSYYVETCRANQHRDGERFEQTAFEGSSNQMAGQFGFGKLLLRLSLIKARLDEYYLSTLETNAELTAKKVLRSETLCQQAAEVQQMLAKNMHQSTAKLSDATEAPPQVKPAYQSSMPGSGMGSFNGLISIPQLSVASTAPELSKAPKDKIQSLVLPQSLNSCPIVRSEHTCKEDMERTRQELEAKMTQVKQELKLKDEEDKRRSESQLGAIKDNDTVSEDEEDDCEDEYAIEDLELTADTIFNVDISAIAQEVIHLRKMEEQLKARKCQILHQLASGNSDTAFLEDEASSDDTGCQTPESDSPPRPPAATKVDALPDIPPEVASAALDHQSDSCSTSSSCLTQEAAAPVPETKDSRWARLSQCIHSFGPKYDTDMWCWRLTLSGNAVPGREGGLYTVTIFLPVDDSEFPRIQYETPIFHPNVNSEGCCWYPYISYYSGEAHNLVDLVYHTAQLFCEPRSTPIACLNERAAVLCFGDSHKETAEYEAQVRHCAKATTVSTSEELDFLRERYQFEVRANAQLQLRCQAMKREAYDMVKELHRKTELLKKTDSVITELCHQTRLQKEMIDAQARVIQEKDEIASATWSLAASKRRQTDESFSHQQASSPAPTLCCHTECPDSPLSSMVVLSPITTVPSPLVPVSPAFPGRQVVLPRVMARLVTRVLLLLLGRLSKGLRLLSFVVNFFRLPPPS